MWAGMDRGQLEAHQAAAGRAQATAPPDVSGQLRATAQAEADARQQSADAQIRSDTAEAASASALASELAARRRQLEADNAEYEALATQTRVTRENGNHAAAELQRRDRTQPRSEQQAQPGSNPKTAADAQRSRQLDNLQAAEQVREAASQRAEPGTDPQTTAEWWRQFEADIAAVERAIERQHQAAIAAGQPWPPRYEPQADAEPETTPETEPPRKEPATGHDDPDARLTEAISDMEEAARHFREEQATQQARTEYAAQVSRQAQTGPAAHATLAAEAPADLEMEL
jgi:hypothetical protein